MVPPQMLETMGRQGEPIRVPITEKATEVDEGWKSEPAWLKKAHEAIGCGCKNKTAEAIKILYGKDPRE